MWKAEVNRRNYYSRLDKFLRRNLNEVPLSALYKFMRKGKVYVNGKRVRDGSYKLQEGDMVEIRYVDLDNFRRRKDNSLEPQKMDLEVLYEDDHVLILNKPAGIALHPGKNIHVATLIEGLMYYGNEKGFEPHLVHRLDLNTSGALIVAKDKAVARKLTEMFKKREIKKEYLTLVRGYLDRERGSIDIPLGGQEALTEYEVLSAGNGVSYLRVRIKTGRKHQIRRHFSMIGHHVVGDNKYGEKAFNREFKKMYGLKRQFLHCSSLDLNHPVDGKRLKVVAPLSEDLRRVLERLKIGR